MGLLSFTHAWSCGFHVIYNDNFYIAKTTCQCKLAVIKVFHYGIESNFTIYFLRLQSNVDFGMLFNLFILRIGINLYFVIITGSNESRSHHKINGKTIKAFETCKMFSYAFIYSYLQLVNNTSQYASIYQDHAKITSKQLFGCQYKIFAR